jgi:hypothetical protein
MARPRLSDAEKQRRGTFQPSRAWDTTPSVPDDDPEDYLSWLEGLTPLAQAEGGFYLEQLIPGDRDAFRAYVEHRAEWIRRYPLRDAPIHEKIRDNEEGTHLLEAVKGRWRR